MSSNRVSVMGSLVVAMMLGLNPCMVFAGYQVEWTLPFHSIGIPWTSNSQYAWSTDGDSAPELFVPDSAVLHIYSGQTHNLLWDAPTPGFEYPGNFLAYAHPGIYPFYVARLHGGSSLQLVVPAYRADSLDANGFFVYDCATHALEYSSPLVAELGGVFVADIDGDGRDEICQVCGDTPQLLVYGWTGAGISMGSTPAVVNDPVRVLPCPARRSILFCVPGAPDGASIDVTDAVGRRIRRIPTIAATTNRQVTWDCNDDRGLPVVPGTYFYRCGGASGKLEVVK